MYQEKCNCGFYKLNSCQQTVSGYRSVMLSEHERQSTTRAIIIASNTIKNHSKTWIFQQSHSVIYLWVIPPPSLLFHLCVSRMYIAISSKHLTKECMTLVAPNVIPHPNVTFLSSMNVVLMLFPSECCYIKE